MRVGFIGTGQFARARAESLRRVGGEAAACYSPGRRNREAFGEEFSARVFAEPLEMIRPEVVDALFIMVPTDVCDGTFEGAAVEAGVPFLCEKPVGMDAGTVADISRRVRERGLVTTSGYILRHGPAAAAVREFLAGREISIVRSCRMQPPLGAWYARASRSGGLMHQAGTHTIDFMRWTLGEIESVSALTSSGISPKLVEGADVYDSMSARMVFASGTIAEISVSGICTKAARRMELLDVYGLHFRLVIDDIGEAGRVRYLEGEGDWKELRMDPIPQLVDEHTRNFLEAVEKSDPSAVLGSYPDAAKSCLVSLAMNESASKGGAPVKPDST
jgi:predicted dehydrogenase